MRLHVHATCWNEERMLPFFLRHYAPIAERIFIYDDGSDDRSLAILAKSKRVHVESISSTGDSYIESLGPIYSECWKRSRGQADWVVVCNVDEHFHHPAGLGNYLEGCRRAGVTLIPARGYNMFSDRFPPTDCVLAETIRRSSPHAAYDKTCVFRPDAIEEIGFQLGRHRTVPIGDVVVPETTELLLLHYKHLGLEYLLERYAQLGSRRRAADVAKGYGYQYAFEESFLRERLRLWNETAFDVVPEPAKGIAATLKRWFVPATIPTVKPVRVESSEVARAV